jgi:hypothetical protein
MKKILPFCLLAIGLGFAQDPWAPEPSSGGISPVAPPPEAKPAGSASFDAVRGHSYNPFGIAGAASSVYDLIVVPSDIYGKKFFYVSPTDKLGYASFDLFGGSTLLGLSNSPYDIPKLVLGFATPGFGVALEYSINKRWTETKAPVGDETATISHRETDYGDNIGLYFSLPLGSATAYANAKWFTYQSTYDEVAGAPDPYPNGWTKVDYSNINGNVGLLGSLGALNYDTYLNIERSGGTMTSSYEDFSSMGEKVVTDDSYLSTALNVNLGYAALKNETTRVIVGFNNMLGITFLDEVDSGDANLAGGNIIKLTISPNILGEVVLADNWLAFAGAKHDINFIFGEETPREGDTSETSISQTATQAFLGIRYQKTNWAFEAQVADNIFNNPFGGFAGNNMFLSAGGFIYF